MTQAASELDQHWGKVGGAEGGGGVVMVVVQTMAFMTARVCTLTQDLVFVPQDACQESLVEHLDHLLYGLKLRANCAPFGLC